MSPSNFSVLRGGRVLNHTAHKADFADLLIEGDTIREIGRPGMVAPEGARQVDVARKLLIPGLVNAHTHGHGSLAKGLGDRWTLELLLNASPWISGGRSLEDKYLAALVNAAEMVRKGCTAAYDLYFEFPAPTPEGLEAVGRAYADMGMRAVVAPMMADLTFYRAIPGLLDAIPESRRRQVEKLRLGPYQASVEASRKLLDRWPFDRSRIRPALAPTIPLHCSDAFLVACRDLAAEYGVGLHTHLAESKVQAVTGLKRYGKTLAAHLDDLRLLGPTFTAAHAVWLDDGDIRRLADHGASIAHNPGSNMRLGTGLAPVRAMLEAGLSVGIGSDGSSSSDNQNMFEAMRLASFVSRVQTPAYEAWLTTDEVVTLATSGSARVLGFDDIGRFEPGFRADIVVLDLANINYVPLNDATNQIVHSEDGSAVDSVMIGGRMVLEGGRFTTIDYGKMLRDVEAAAERLRTANAEMKELALALENTVGTFCVGLAREPYHVHRLGGRAESEGEVM